MKGNPVIVGLAELDENGKNVGIDPEDPNVNVLTGHFVVIKSTTKSSSGQISFGYLDNASPSCGTSIGNQLDLNKATGALTDNTDPCVGGVDKYKATEVRKNR